MIKNTIVICMAVLLCASCDVPDIIDFNVKNSIYENINTTDVTVVETKHIDTTNTEEKKCTVENYIYIDGYNGTKFFPFEDSYVSPNGQYNMQIIGYYSDTPYMPYIISSVSLIDINNGKTIIDLNNDLGDFFEVEWTDDSRFVNIVWSFRDVQGQIFVIDANDYKTLELPLPKEVLLNKMSESDNWVSIIKDCYYMRYTLESSFIDNNIIKVEDMMCSLENNYVINQYYTYNLETNEIVEVKWKTIE